MGVRVTQMLSAIANVSALSVNRDESMPFIDDKGPDNFSP